MTDLFTGINAIEFRGRFQSQEDCYVYLYCVIGVRFVVAQMTLRERQLSQEV